MWSGKEEDWFSSNKRSNVEVDPYVFLNGEKFEVGPTKDRDFTRKKQKEEERVEE